VTVIPVIITIVVTNVRIIKLDVCNVDYCIRLFEIYIVHRLTGTTTERKIERSTKLVLVHRIQLGYALQ
jgi:hypothetical protein